MKKALPILLMSVCIMLLAPACKKNSNDDSDPPFGRVTQKNLPLEKVDMNLPSGNLWASYNLGATAPDEPGDYYAWGETGPKEYYQWDNYRFGEEKALTRYVFNDPKLPDLKFGKDGFTDDIRSLLKEDDAAAVKWQDKWCIPSMKDFEELFDNCDVSWEQYEKGSLVWGMRFKRKKEPERELFIPAAGIYYARLDYLNVKVSCWTSTLTESYGLACQADSFGTDRDALFYFLRDHSSLYAPYHSSARYCGMSIRPVYK